jgi:hypothetical protein
VADRLTVVDMGAALLERSHPTLTLWNRLEGRPRTADFDRALRAEVRDALWMLTRQWQTGEFRAEDAGSPVSAKLHLATTRLTELRAAEGAARPVLESAPLEAQVERLPVRLTIGAERVALDLRLTLGRRWVKLVAPIGPYADSFRDAYGFDPPDPADADSAGACANAGTWQSFAAVAHRAMDGGRLFEYLTGGAGRQASDDIAVLPAHKQAIDDAGRDFVAWVRRLLTQPEPAEVPAWRADRFEYDFACSAPTVDGAQTFVAREYQAAGLDWHTFDAERAGPGTVPDSPGGATLTRTLIPTPVTYPGMPHPRWWTMEDGRTNFGDVRPDTRDLAKLLLLEFGLVYSNDWFGVPLTLESGTIASVEGLVVTSVFGERLWIEPVGRGEPWQRWDLFALNAHGEAGPAYHGLVLPATSPKVQEGAPLEEVLFLRDEMANMVWGVERTIPAPEGGGRSGALAGRETRAFHERRVALGNQLPPPPLLPNDATIGYQLMSVVPEHWIPFIPVHVGGGPRAIQLQRASVPRVIPRDPLPPAAVKPRTGLLREGLDVGQPYFIPEEEVPRSGVRVIQAFRRARWRDGSVHVWLAAHKQIGRGEGSSGLAYDRIVARAPE